MKLLWIDIETTGLDPEKHSLIEIAVMPDVDGDPGTLSQFFVDDRVHDVWAPGAYRMHEQSGLVADWQRAYENKEILSVEAVELAIIGKLRLLAKPREFTLAGSSVHFDRSFLRHKMPQLNEFLHYRHMDVSAVETFLTEATKSGKWKKHDGTAAHRAVADLNHVRNRYYAISKEVARWVEQDGNARVSEQTAIQSQRSEEHAQGSGPASAGI